MRRLTRTRWAWVAVLLVAVAVPAVASGCAATPSPTPVASLPTGWTRTSITSDGYSIATPPSWSSVAIGGQDIDAMIAELKSTNSEIADLLQQARDAGQTFSFASNATDAALIGDTGFAPNVIVEVTDARGHDAAYIATDTFIALSKLDSVHGDIEDAAYPLPADPSAHRLRYELTSSPDLTLVSTLFVLTRDDKVYGINVSAVGSQLPGLESSIATMAQSFTFLAP